MRLKRLSFASINLLVVAAVSLLLTPGTWAASKYKVLYNFKGGDDAEGGLYGSLAFDQQGDLFGTAGGGGQNSNCGGTCGVVYELTPNGNGGWTESIAFDFQYSGTGYGPLGGVILGPSENLYGTDQRGGTYDNGVVFALTPNGSGWAESILYNFGRSYGSPFSGLVRDAAGNLYGVAGSLYELSPKIGGGWTEHVLYHFHPHAGKDGTDGYAPVGALVLDAVGNLCGATELGGNYPPMCSGSAGCGTVYELTPEADGKWKEHVLHRFAQFKNDGQLPEAGVVIDQHGNLYGTTMEGGSFRNKDVCLVGCGTVFELTKDAKGHWREVILHSFDNGEGGNGPLAPVILDKAGNLYGTASAGGTQNQYCGPLGCGVVFKLTRPANGRWKYSVLHSFTGYDGNGLIAGLTFDAKGNLYGATLSGGAYGYGVVFELEPR